MKKLFIIFLFLFGVSYFIVLNVNQVEGIDDVPSIHSANAMLLESKTGKVLMAKGTDQHIYPASLTKIMTAILAIEHFDNLQTTIIIEQSDLEYLNEKNASVAGFQVGDEVTVEDLLYGAILSSGADATTVLAKGVSGSEESFAKLMNKRAKEIGMEKTHFVNASGLHNPNHYSTVNDISKLIQYALKNEKFKEIFTTPSHITKPLNSAKSGLVLSSTLFNKLWEPTLENEATIIGGKTGFTPQAGLCLASLAVKDGKEYILITTNAKIDSNKTFHIDDAVTIFNKL